MKYFLIYLKSILVGLANIIPGLCSATVCLVVGIYDDLVYALSLDFGFIKKNWLKLLCIGLGVLTGIFGFSFLVSYLMTNYRTSSIYLFLSLLIGSMPLLIKKANSLPSDVKNKKTKYIIAILFFVLMALTILIKQPNANQIISTLNFASIMLIFVGGIIGAFAVILPGISGGFLLLLMGIYATLINAIKTFNILTLLPFICGMIIGLILGAKFMKKMLNKYPKLTYYAIIGLVFGSLIALFPGFRTGWLIVLDVLIFIVGFVIAYILSIHKKVKNKEN